MAVADLPLLATLKARLHWHQSRQGVLAENVANANTPDFKPKDLKEPAAGFAGPSVSAAPMTVTHALHLAGLTAGPSGEAAGPAKRFEVVPSGNAVNLEDEMLKSAQNQSDFQLAASLYQKSLKMLATAVGKKA